MREALTFDDVALVPQFNNVKSRGEPSLETWLTKGITTGLPLIPSNMDTVIGPEMADALIEWDGDVIDHRFHQHGELARRKDRVIEFNRPICISWGLKDWAGLDLMLRWGLDNGHIWGVCFDVAHGHAEGMFDIMDSTKNTFGRDIEIIAGNVCTQLGYQELVSHGATAVKVGVGCGAACTTRMVTGFGVPQLTAIQDCADLADKLRVPIIADGGIRNSRDVVLALAAGASSVMMGKLFAACKESPAEVGYSTYSDTYRHVPRSYYYDWEDKLRKPVKIENFLFRKYRGQASFDFQQEFYGECRHVPEGESMWIKETGTIDDMLKEITGGIKAGMTYAGATSIKELQRKAEFVRVTPGYRAESGTRL